MAEPGENVLDTRSEVAIANPKPAERVLVGSSFDIPVLSMGTCVAEVRVEVEVEVEVAVEVEVGVEVGIGVVRVEVGIIRIEVGPPEEVEVAEDVTAFFGAKPI